MTIPAWLKRLYFRHDFLSGRPASLRPVQPVLEELEARRVLATHVVTNTLDAGLGSLRQAILDANNDHDATCLITFNIPGTGPQIIQPTSAMPVPTRALTIDGTTQSSTAGAPSIMLDGSRAGSNVDGLTITAGHSTVKGLVISHFRSGIVLETNGGNVIQGNFIGTDMTGGAAMPNRQDGIVITNGSSDNTIGGTDPSDANVISGNGTDANDPDRSGILLDGTNYNVTGNQILGNFIGTDATGVVGIGNGLRGVYIKGGASVNTIGGAGTENIISDNGQAGVQIDGSRNVVAGNLLGVDATGVTALPNGQGILISGGSANTVGGTDPGAGNVISGNNGGGINVLGSGANLVEGNWIGLDITGGVQLGNGSSADGVFLFGASPNNLIVNNVIDAGRYGVWISGAQATGNQIQGNFIGTDYSGTVALHNANDGVLLNAPGNTVGGPAPGMGNVISGCGIDGVAVFQTSNALVQDNLLGTDVTGTVAIPNGFHGVEIDSSSGVQVLGNVISGNTHDGVLLSSATRTVIQGNYVGVDLSGVTALGNGDAGVAVSGGNLNTIGGAAAGTGNVLSANGQEGVLLVGGTFGNVVQGNDIGTGIDAATPLGNRLAGLFIWGNAHDNLIGGVLPGAGNVIADTTAGSGVACVVGPGNSIRQNAIWGNGDRGIILNGTGIPNIPVLTSAVIGGQGITIAGTYAGSPNTAYALEFFANDRANPSGYGEGQYYLGTLTVVTNGSGNASFSAQLNTSVAAGQFISATATTPIGTTSQFALDVAATMAANATRPPVADATIREVAASLPAVAARHATPVPTAAVEDRSIRHALPSAGLAVAAEGSGIGPESVGQHTAPVAAVADSGIDGLFEQWEKLF